MKRYRHRKLPSIHVHLHQQTTIYNDTVAIYHWRDNQKVGVEVVSKTYSRMMRQIFEYFWQISKED